MPTCPHPDHKLRATNGGRHQLHITWRIYWNKETPQYLFARLDMLSHSAWWWWGGGGGWGGGDVDETSPKFIYLESKSRPCMHPCTSQQGVARRINEAIDIYFTMNVCARMSKSHHRIYMVFSKWKIGGYGHFRTFWHKI